jgi:pimeloyl-ACP methyl ester carboxylesterase
MRRLVFAVIAGGLIGTPAAAVAQPPAAVIADPPQDLAHPAGSIAFALPTHGVKINALLYTAAGAGPHPTVLLLHGLPGNETHQDLAHAIQRAGWNVLTLQYRGSWGSPGHYTFTHCLEDADAALAWLRGPGTAQRYGVDPKRIVVAGHSLGGFVAGWIAGHDDGIAGAVLISVGRSFSILPNGTSRADLVDRMEANLNNKEGMHTVGDTTAEELADEVIRNNVAWDLNQFAGSLAKHPLFVISSDDGGASANNQLAAAVAAHPGANVTTRHFATDHGYDDQRVSLASAVVLWLEKRAPESGPRGGGQDTGP